MKHNDFYVEAIEVAEKLRETKSLADARAIFEIIRKEIVNQPSIRYELILQKCLHFEDIYASDAKYPIFRDDIPALLKEKSHDERILLLTYMIMCF